MVFTSQKIRFYFQIRFFDTEKTASSGKKIKENDFHQQENVFLFKLVPLDFNNGFQHQKRALNKSILFPTQKISFH